jgi:hypothetical protein
MILSPLRDTPESPETPSRANFQRWVYKIRRTLRIFLDRFHKSPDVRRFPETAPILSRPRVSQRIYPRSLLQFVDSWKRPRDVTPKLKCPCTFKFINPQLKVGNLRTSGDFPVVVFYFCIERFFVRSMKYQQVPHKAVYFHCPPAPCTVFKYMVGNKNGPSYQCKAES